MSTITTAPGSATPHKRRTPPQPSLGPGRAPHYGELPSEVTAWLAERAAGDHDAVGEAAAPVLVASSHIKSRIDGSVEQ